MDIRVTKTAADRRKPRPNDSELGFGKYSNNGNTLTGSEARRLVDKRVADRRKEIADMEAEMDRTMSAIWTATELSEVKPMVDEILAGV